MGSLPFPGSQFFSQQKTNVGEVIWPFDDDGDVGNFFYGVLDVLGEITHHVKCTTEVLTIMKMTMRVWYFNFKFSLLDHNIIKRLI